MRLLALDFDGVLCDGRAEYFESSRRAYGHFWSPSTLRVPRGRDRFYTLRPVVMSGWEMPLLLRALALGVADAAILRDWSRIRERVLADEGVDRDGLVTRLRRALDDVRRDRIWIDSDGWVAGNRPYASLDRVQRVIDSADRAVVVTTKEGEFARLIVERWGLTLDTVYGKEAGEHKCENLVSLIDAHTGGDGTPPHVAFVEDRLETLQCVVRCSAHEPRLARVALYLASWGYLTPRARALARHDVRIRLLTLPAFLRGVTAWPV